jgi:tetratricopeptide (TPR) repeat protein
MPHRPDGRRTSGAILTVAGTAALVAACGTGTPAYQAISLLGDTLRTPVPSEEVAGRYASLLAVARTAYERTPSDLDSIIWIGRRTAYLGRYREAIEIYTDGLAVHPDEPRLLRHRGHRHISVRQLDSAVADLERAAELMTRTPDRVEEDGLPNERGVPTSTLYTNVWYHLGLARYLLGDFSAARDAYGRGLAASANPDMATAMRYWLALIHQRLGDTAAVRATLAAVDADADIIENHAYHRLLLHFRGDLPRDSLLPADTLGSLEDVTTAYGVAVWDLVHRREEVGLALLRRMLDARDQWPAFGYIAAEAELARRRSTPEG